MAGSGPVRLNPFVSEFRLWSCKAGSFCVRVWPLENITQLFYCCLPLQSKMKMKLRAEFFLQAFLFTPHFSPVFSQFHSAPLYLEWAPMGVFLSPAPQKRKAGVPGKEDEAGLVPGENCG